MNQKQKREKEKEKAKKKKKLFKSNYSICSKCGYIGKAKKKKVGSWIMFSIKLTFVIPIILLIIFLSIAEGLLRFIALTPVTSIIWNIGFERFFPHFPYILYGCLDCKSANSMNRLKTLEGKTIYERFERDHFLMRR